MQRSALLMFSAPMTIWVPIVFGFALLAAGCGGPATDTTDVEASSDSHAHHDHDDHDHDHDHDHAHHDHGGSTVVDAKAEGLSADELVALDEPEPPKTLNEAIDQLVALRDTIRDGLKADDIDAAHGPLHDIGRVLESIEQLSGELSMDSDQKKKIVDAVSTLFDCYGAVDEAFHGKEGKPYDEVEADIDAAVKTLDESRPSDVEGES